MTSPIPFVKPERTRDAEEVIAERTRPSRTGRVQPVEIDHILPNPWQPRGRIVAEELTPLATSIKNYGFEGHLEVRQRDGRLELAAGHRRLQAARLAGEKTVPCLIVDYSDEQMMEISLLENITREDLTPWEEAQQIDLIRRRNQLSVRGMAKFIGKPKGWVENRLALLELPEELQEEARAGTIEISTAMALSRMKRQGATEEEIAEAVRAYKTGSLTGEQFLRIQKAHKDLKGDVTNDEGRLVRTIALVDQVLQGDTDDDGPDPERLASRVFIGASGMMEIARPEPVELVPAPEMDPEQAIVRRTVELPQPPKVEHSQWSSGRDWALRVADMVGHWAEHLPFHLEKAELWELSPDELDALRANRDRLVDALSGL